MLGTSGTYANKKRKKPVLKQKKVPDSNEGVKSNPSKRHRDRLNGELDRLTDLLPFPEDVRSCLDKLSVLRLSVGYLRVKSYFKASMKNANSSSRLCPAPNGPNGNSMDTNGFSEGDLLLQALNGFVLVITSEGLIFYVSPTMKDYLGFQQSDVVHQSVYELIHTDDRALFRQQLHFSLNPPDNGADFLQNMDGYSPDHLPPENSSFLERSFVCRFRCLLDNSSGFLALKFQGRLKYLHGQRIMSDNGTCIQPHLALFAIAMPVQSSLIVEIRTKMLLFQSKHKLDFTPTGIDGRGKVILGYSEIELCMKGSGYQFIHAADMMYCADNHIRMIKTGESGMTVFRLLSKSGGWVWVKANAKLIYKGGRPEFIIAYQRALAKGEGEEYLRQRRMQLPFNLTTGEGVLYDTGPTMDLTQSQFNKNISNNNVKKDTPPVSLLDCFLKQSESVYNPAPAVDQLFMDSQPVVSALKDSWQGPGAAALGSEPVVVKEEAKQSVMAVINTLEEMARKGDYREVFENLEVDNGLDWKNCQKAVNPTDKENDIRSELDCILTDEIFDYIDNVLFKEKGEDALNGGPSVCFSAVGGDQQLSTAALGEQGLFQARSPDWICPQINGGYAHLHDSVNGQMNPEQSSAGSSQIFSSSQKLTHLGPLMPPTDTNGPSLQQLQLQDIFNPSIDLPELSLPGTSVDDGSVSFQSCRQPPPSSMGCTQGIPGQMPPRQPLMCPQSAVRGPAVAVSGQLRQRADGQPPNVAPSVTGCLPPLISCSDFNSTPNVPVTFSPDCLQDSLPFENHQLQPWPPSQSALPHAAAMQDIHTPAPLCHGQGPESQTFLHAGAWPRTVNGLAQTQHGGLACDPASTHSSCMFNQHFPSPVVGETMVLPGSSCQRGVFTSVDQSPPQGSCYYQWGRSEPVVGTSAINQDSADISPGTVLPSVSFMEHTASIQQYLE